MKDPEERRKNNAQVLLSDQELQLITQATKRLNAARVSLSALGRELLVKWAEHVLRRPGKVFGGDCGSCSVGTATWCNREQKIFVCADCAATTNGRNPYPICVENGEPMNGWLKKGELEEIMSSSRDGLSAKKFDPFRKKVQEVLAAIVDEAKGLLEESEQDEDALPREIAELVAGARRSD